jgi:hypothetical protein
LAVGRNDLCPCGSGKKYKRCCLNDDQMVGLRANYVNPVTSKAKIEVKPSPNVTLLEENSPIDQEIDTEQKPSRVSTISKEDLELMEEIGIPFEEASQFYVRDILDCFKEKAVGKSQSTYYKYRLGLQTIGFFLSRRIHTSWDDVNRDDWEKWLSYHYLVFNNDATSNQVKGFISVLKGFVTKVDETYGTDHLSTVVKMIKDLEPSILDAIKVLDFFANYQERRNEDVYSLDYLWDLLHREPTVSEQSAEGVFVVKEVSANSIKMNILDASEQDYEVIMDKQNLESIREGNILICELVHKEQWDFGHVIRIFPSQALKFVRESMRK